LVWKNTVLSDDPHLWIRQVWYTDPLRIVLDSTLTTSLTSQVYRDTHVLVATTQAAGEERIQEFHDAWVTVIVCTWSRVDLPELMEKLYALHITWILVEWGAEVLWSFFDEQLVDKVYITQAPTLMWWIWSQSAIWWIWVSSISDLIHLTNIERTYIQDDMHISWYPIYSGI
jgi:diaminohydroxyphosphoribosylaminopyrimidine deaminase/5-amino-6-(5-phosphoribosylamino)uracil reductase